MTKISQYSVDQNIRGNDKWIGSDSQNYLMTKNFTPNGLADFFNNNNVIDIGVSIRYTYQTLDPGEQREQGTISFETEIGPQVNFSAISTFLLAKKTLKYNDVSQYLNFLIDSYVVISKSSNINVFGYYKITDIQPYLPDTDFFVVTLEFIAGNGFIYEDLDYLISLIDKPHNDYVPLTREITINDTTYDLSQDRSWTLDGTNINVTDPTDSSEHTLNDTLQNLYDNVPAAPTLESVLIQGNETNGNNISISNGDAVVLDNGARLKKGTTDAGLGGLGGIALKCSVDYELKWDAGRLFIMQQDGFTIREVLYSFNIPPTASDDDTLGYVVGSRWTLDNGDTYECTDNTTGAAVWDLVNYGTFPITSNEIDAITNSDSPSSSNPFTTELWVGNNYYPLSTNPAGYLTQDDVQEYADLASFPNPGTIGVIYVALDTGLFYTWNGSSYVSSSPPNTGITGVGTTNYIPKWTSPTQVGNSIISQFNSKVFIGGGQSATTTRGVLNIYNTDHNNPGSFSYLVKEGTAIGDAYYHGAKTTWSDNVGVEHVWHDGIQHTYLQFAWNKGCVVGTQYPYASRIHLQNSAAQIEFYTLNTERFRIQSDGQLAIYTTPNTGATTDKLLVRDTSGNVKQIDYPTISGTIPHATASGTDTYTATVTGVTSYSDGDAYLVRFTNGNTTTATLNINSLGAVTLYKNNDGHLIGGDIWDGAEMLCVYNSTLNGFQCIGTSPNALFSYVTNDDSVTLTKGMPVYAFSGTGDRMTVKRANNSSDATSAQTVGIVASTSIAANQKGIIIMQGLLDGLSILPTSTWSDGSPVYLGATAGSITATKPYAPNHLVYLGVVTTASNGSAGRMYVRVQNGYELDELHNVQAQSPSINDILYYFGGSPGQWKTASIPTVLGYTPVTDARTISTTSPLSGGGNLTANRTLSITQANTSTDGYLSSTDWNTFNGKQAATSSAILSTLGWYNYKNTVSSSTLTGTTAETQLLQVTIPANTFAASDFVKFIVDFSKTGTAGTATYRVKLSTSSTMPSGATSQVGVYTTAATNLFIKMNRNLTVKSGNITGFPFTATQISDINVSNAAISSVAFDVTVTQYLYVSATLANSADSTYMNSIQITNI